MAHPLSNPSLSWNSSFDLTQARYWHLTGVARGVILLRAQEQKPGDFMYLFTSNLILFQKGLEVSEECLRHDKRR